MFKKVNIFGKALFIILLLVLTIGIYFSRSTKVYSTEEYGIFIKNIVNEKEYYKFVNTNDEQKIILGYHLSEPTQNDINPLFKIVIPAYAESTIEVKKGFTDQIKICKFGPDKKINFIVHIDAKKLRKGELE